MTKTLFIISFFFLVNDGYSQYLKLDNGIVFSSFHNKKDLNILSSERLSSYGAFLGTDYLDRDWFYLSSQMGFIKVGGEETNPALEGANYRVSESGNFLHLNTTFRAYKKIAALRLFLGVGPYGNVLISDKSFDSPLYRSDYKFKRVSVGGKADIGITREIKKFRIGLMGSYMLDLSPSAESQNLSLYNKAFSATVSIGYALR